MSPNEKLAKITEILDAGGTVYINTHTKSTKVNKKTADKFQKAGYLLFKVSDNSLWIASGKKFVCIDFCSITYCK